MNGTQEEKTEMYIQSRKNFYQNYNKDIGDSLFEFRKNIIDNYNKLKYSGQDCVRDTSWMIESSFLFTLSVLTTIGKIKSCYYFI